MLMEAEISAGTSSSKISLTIIGLVAFTFIGYFIIGLALAVLPVFIHRQLGYSTVIAGAVISLQYVTTFLCRAYAGNVVDKKGPKPAVTLSMIGFAASGVFLFAAWLLRDTPALSLGVLAVTRLITGFGEGLVGASPINWAILTVGDKYTAKAISLNGIASYGAIAVGASIGVIIDNSFGLGVIGLLVIALALIGFLYAKSKTPVKGTSKAARQPFLQVLKKVSPYGICMGLGGIGFGTISTFITLYYIYQNWHGAVLCLSAFSVLFIVGRIVFSEAIEAYGGLKTTIVCLSLETVGLLILWLAHVPYLAVAGAGIAGLGFSLVFPAMGVEAVKLIPASNQGAALGSYGLFIDISLGLTGPLVGGIISQFGMEYIFPFSMAMVMVGLGIAVWLAYSKREIAEA